MITAANSPKLEPGNYNGLFQMLKKTINDPNKVVAGHAVKAIGALAKGLRKEFANQAKEAVPVLCAALKEKRMIEDI